MHTMKTESENERSSAAVNLPHIPNEILLPSEHGLMIYWHIGNSKNAKATVAITKTLFITTPFIKHQPYLLAVQIAKSICMESKKKNMTSSDTLAPSGRHSACMVSSVWTLFSAWTCWEGFSKQFPLPPLPAALSLASCSIFRLLNDPYTIRSIEIRKVETRLESIIE